jgi:hypothetical protein
MRPAGQEPTELGIVPGRSEPRSGGDHLLARSEDGSLKSASVANGAYPENRQDTGLQRTWNAVSGVVRRVRNIIRTEQPTYKRSASFVYKGAAVASCRRCGGRWRPGSSSSMRTVHRAHIRIRGRAPSVETARRIAGAWRERRFWRLPNAHTIFATRGKSLLLITLANRRKGDIAALCGVRRIWAKMGRKRLASTGVCDIAARSIARAKPPCSIEC